MDKRKKAPERQRKRRDKMSENQKQSERHKAKVGMRKSRLKKEVYVKKQEAKEKRMLQRLEKKTGIPYDPDGQIDIDQHNFNCYLKSLTWFVCPKCHKKKMISHYSKKKCGPNCDPFFDENDMNPMSVPLELQNLTFIERQLIARIHTVMSLYTFKECQYKYSGQVINFSQDVQSVAEKLPHLVSNLNNVVIVKLSENIVLQDFVVRKPVVLAALLWLKANNPNYSDIKIGYANLDSLPIHDNVYDQLQKVETDITFPADFENIDDNTTDDSSDITDDEDSEINFSYTDVPELMDSSLKKSLDNVLIWPSIGKTPVNEFSSPGFISLAFPHLFPYGKADFSMPRIQKVSLKDYIRHLMLYCDSRFAQDERFRYFIMNSEMRWTALNIGNIYVKKNSFFSKMTIVQLKDF
ncbi:hypothetical protein FOCC_FOCC015232 [Frankliniella occidentalis]|nr:hypothetical protein FOCC_FOCC015232 [Frankliniella occidentalis]